MFSFLLYEFLVYKSITINFYNQKTVIYYEAVWSKSSTLQVCCEDR